MPKIKPLTEVENIPAFIQQVNSNFEKIEEAFDNTVSRDGSTPNEMNAALDMNGQNIINIGGVSFVDGPVIIAEAENVLFDTPVGWIADNVQEGIEEAYQKASDETTLVENSVTTLSGNAVRVDVAQSHSPSEQTQGRDNLGLGNMATKDDVAIADIDATGTADATTFLRGDGAWVTLEATQIGPVAVNSGASVTLATGLPAGVTWFEVYLDQIQATSANNFEVRLGDSGGELSTGYVSNFQALSTAGTSTTGFGILTGGANRRVTGVARFRKVGSLWIYDLSAGVDAAGGGQGGGWLSMANDLYSISIRVLTSGNFNGSGAAYLRYGQ